MADRAEQRRLIHEMKILHIITGLNNGGAEAVLYRLTTADKENTHQVISMMDGGIYEKLLTRAGVPVHTLEMPRGWITFKGIIKLYQLIRFIRPDVVQTWMYHANLIGGVVARLVGIRALVWGIHGPYDSRLTTVKTKIVIFGCAYLSGWLSKAIVSCSAYSANVHKKIGYCVKKFIVIPNGYPIDCLNPDKTARYELLAELNLQSKAVVIGMVARFDPYKDHENLFKALSAIIHTGREINCILAGLEMEITNKPLRSLIEKYGIQKEVKLIGPRDDVPKIMASLDLHVLSSAAESFPNVLAEAMTCGTPCVTTDVGDAALIVGNTGWVVPPSNPDALANAIQEAMDEMEDMAKWNARKEACRLRIVENYSLERMVESYNRVWNDAINDK